VANTGNPNNFQNDLEVAVLHKHALAMAVEGDLEQFVHYCLIEMLGYHLVLMLTSLLSHSGLHNNFQILRKWEDARVSSIKAEEA
jgi:hypothetical protein